MCFYCFLIFYRQGDDETYHWRQNSLGKDFYKDDINSSGQYVCILKYLIVIVLLKFITNFILG